MAASDPQTGYAPVNGLKMYYEIRGEGPPLVLLHGAYMTIDMMGPLLPGLAESRRVIAVEQQGHGHTGDIDRPITYEQMADDTAALLGHLGVANADAVGYSMGSGVALQLAIRHPDIVRKLVIASASRTPKRSCPRSWRRSATSADRNAQVRTEPGVRPAAPPLPTPPSPHRLEGRPRYRSTVKRDDDRPARVEDVHDFALAMPHVTVERGSQENPVYQVGGKSFVFFRNPRPDAVDPDTGERYDDVIVIWVESDDDKAALVQDPHSPFFTTDHFNGHRSVLVRASRLGEITREELRELLQDAWLARASKHRAIVWLADHR
jgi:pimeloyl-ACP methyl ester carboxylesterase